MEEEKTPGDAGAEGTGKTDADAASGEASPVVRPAPPADGYGARLKAAREALGVSLGDMAVHSRLSVQQVRALEEEDMSELPEPVYVRAFIRGACRLLQIDAQPLVDDFNARFAGVAPGTARLSGDRGQIPEDDPAREQVISGSTRRISMKAALFVGLVGLVAAGLWAVYTDQLSFLRPSGTEEAAGGTPALEAQAEPAAADAAQASSSSTGVEPAAVPAPEAPHPAPAEGEGSGAPVAAEAPVQPAGAPEAEAAERPAQAPVGNVALHKVEFFPAEPCWVQVISPAGRNLLAQELSAGTARTIDVPVGSRFTIGNPTRLRLAIDGEQRDLARWTRNGVARFTIQ